MNTLAFLVATVLACVFARPQAGSHVPPVHPMPLGTKRQRIPSPPLPDYLNPYLLPRYLMPHEIVYDDIHPHDLLDQEIHYINQLDAHDLTPIPYDQYQQWMHELPSTYIQMFGGAVPDDHTRIQFKPKIDVIPYIKSTDKSRKTNNIPINGDSREINMNTIDAKKIFAWTPLDPEYYKDANVSPKNPTLKAQELKEAHTEEHIEDHTEEHVDEQANERSGDGQPEDEQIDPRQTRQNPNWRKSKTFVAEDIDALRAGFTQSDSEGTDTPHLHHVLETNTGVPGESIYGVALIAAVGVALTMAIVGLAFGWYTLSRKAKAAAEVEYPAYGVTGPTVDQSGDRNLAQSAHMYHYQHQKQQIIAMERNEMERNGSVSDAESDEENEEGDYTVYECPGFATTGEMEVKNPMFTGENTPASPKCAPAKAEPEE